jgi:hypothetical protein
VLIVVGENSAAEQLALLCIVKQKKGNELFFLCVCGLVRWFAGRRQHQHKKKTTCRRREKRKAMKEENHERGVMVKNTQRQKKEKGDEKES